MCICMCCFGWILDVGKNAHPAQDIWVSCALQRYNRGVSQRKESMEAQEQTQQVQSAGVKSEVVMPEGQAPENPAAERVLPRGFLLFRLFLKYSALMAG